MVIKGSNDFCLLCTANGNMSTEPPLDPMCIKSEEWMGGL